MAAITTAVSPMMWTTAFAQEEGVDTADENVYDNTGLGSNADKAFHEGLCQAGISTTVLDTPPPLQGCDTPIITEPSSSDNVRQDN